VLANTASLDAELARLSNIRYLAWNLRDIAGMERSHVAQAISAKTAIAADKLSAIAEVRAQVALLRKTVGVNLKQEEYPAVTKGLKLAEDGYYGKVSAARRPDAQALRRGRLLSDVGATMGRHHDASALHLAGDHVRRGRGE